MEQVPQSSEIPSMVNDQLVKIVTGYKVLLDMPLDDGETEDQRQEEAGIWLHNQLQNLSYTERQLNTAFWLNF